MNESDAHPHVLEEKARLFTAPEWVGGMEKEYADLIFSLIRALKPVRILETGTGYGYTSCEIVRALILNNNGGRLYTVEISDQCINAARQRLSVFQNADRFYTIAHRRALEFIQSTSEQFDFALIDSDLSERAEEVTELRAKLRPHAVIAVHDTSRLRTLENGKPDPSSHHFWEHIAVAQPPFQIIELPLSRGLTLLQSPE